MTDRPLASELRDADRALEDWLRARASAPRLIERLRAYATIPPRARVLEVGAGQGVQLAALAAAGYSAVGVEPSARARGVGAHVGERTRQRLQILDGVAEELPFPDESFALVLADSVMEHVTDPLRAAHEAHRVLCPGGGFYFATTSALCPRQSEIRGFPAFPWYPDATKRRLMRWAAASRPALVGYSQTPAYHWFTPQRAAALAHGAGFSAIYDRWDVRTEQGMGPVPARLLRVIRSRTAFRRIGDLFLEGSTYLFVK